MILILVSFASFKPIIALESFDLKDAKITGFNSKNIGTNKITVEYNNHFAYFDVEIIDVKIESISMSQLPTKTDYIQNYENLDLTGALLEIKYSNEKAKDYYHRLAPYQGYDSIYLCFH